jgi:hypothetical protein
VERWLAGGAVASGRFDAKGALVPPCRARPLAVRQGPESLPIRGCENWVETRVFDTSTFGLQWQPSALEPWTGKLRRGAFPQYYRQGGNELSAVAAEAVPEETGLKAAHFLPAAGNAAYTSPHGREDGWHRPGPKAGPFRAKLADGSVVTYSWYRFIDQPSLQDADLSEVEKSRLQAVVGKLHAHWTLRKEYMPAPGMGTLTALDPALVVKPPRGLEVGYVPIVTRQSPP